MIVINIHRSLPDGLQRCNFFGNHRRPCIPSLGYLGMVSHQWVWPWICWRGCESAGRAELGIEVMGCSCLCWCVPCTARSVLGWLKDRRCSVISSAPFPLALQTAASAWHHLTVLCVRLRGSLLPSDWFGPLQREPPRFLLPSSISIFPALMPFTSPLLKPVTYLGFLPWFFQFALHLLGLLSSSGLFTPPGQLPLDLRLWRWTCMGRMVGSLPSAIPCV